MRRTGNASPVAHLMQVKEDSVSAFIFKLVEQVPDPMPLFSRRRAKRRTVVVTLVAGARVDGRNGQRLCAARAGSVAIAR
jgi:hypothetical protein